MEDGFLRSLQLICTLVSAAVLATGTIAALRKRRAQQPVRGAAPTLLFSIGVFLALFIASVPLAIAEGHDIFSAAIVAIITTFQAVFFNRDFTGISQQILAITGGHTLLTNLMVLYFAFLHLVSPLLVIGVILSLLKDTSFRLRALFTRGRSVHVFSVLNERTLLLAEDISANSSSRHMLIFTTSYTRARETECQWVTRAEAIRAIFLPTDISLLRYSRKAALCFHLMGDDIDQNLEQAITLIHRNKDRDNAELFVRSNRRADELILDSVDKGMLRVHIVNEPRLIVQGVLERHPLFLGAVDRTISLLLVGGGRIGFEMLKAACWCGQLPGYHLRIQVVDREADTLRNRLAFECPELYAMSTCAEAAAGNLSGRTPKTADCQYPISFLSAEIASDAFTRLLAGPERFTYVVVAIGDDEQNLSTAVTIRQHLARRDIYAGVSQKTNPAPSPTIVTILESEDRETIAGSLSERRGGPVGIRAFGCLRDLYRHDKLVDSLVERLALQVHLSYADCFSENEEPDGKPPRYMTVEEKATRDAASEKKRKATLAYYQQAYERKSSLATALHLKYKMYALLGHDPNLNWEAPPTLAMADRYAQALQDPETFSQQLQLEHDRWNAYVRTEGYCAADEAATAQYLPSVSHHKNDLARLHPCIVPWEDLGRVSDFVNRLQTESGINASSKDFYRQDETLVRLGPALLRKALSPTVRNTPYTPVPIKTSGVHLSPDVRELAETLAKNTHEVWSKGRVAEGWSYGPTRDDTAKTHPGLIPYEELSETEKDYDRNTSMETLKLITQLGYTIKRRRPRKGSH